MLTHRFTGPHTDPAAFALACQDLAAEARRIGTRARLEGAAGEVLAVVDDQGRFHAAPSMACASEPLADGWYRTAADVTYYVHEGRPFSLRCGERLAVAPLEALPADAIAVPEDDVDGFQQAGAELIEAFCSRGGK